MSTEIPDLPAINWLVHVLTENIGWSEWIPKSPEERTGEPGEYPYKVVNHPIPAGKAIVLEHGKYRIDCDSERTRAMIVELARRYREMEREKFRLRREVAAKTWHPVEEIPHGYGPASSWGPGLFLVTSPAIRYALGDVCLGLYDGHPRRWYALYQGKKYLHAITHWRELPPAPEATPAYEEVRAEVEQFRRELGL
jgi:hypothetical protein